MHERSTLRVLRADCERCAGLCCVAPAFAVSADFAIDKPAGEPCPNLQRDDRCGIHARLRDVGFAGCAVFDCFGAGQRVTQELFPGEHWRTDPGVATAMFAAFPVVRRLHELLWYLDAARALPAARPIHGELRAARERTDALVGRDTGPRSDAELAAHLQQTNELLRRASSLARARFAGSAADLRGADLVGADLRSTDLRGADLRGALLIGADLRGADLVLADVTGADLRAADLAGADLRGALFVVQAQLDAAKGDRRTGIPSTLDRPAHWG